MKLEEIKQIPIQGKIKQPNGSFYPLRDSVNPDEVEDLYNSILELKPSTTLEIGLATGVSAIAICGALDELKYGMHHAIDPFQVEWGNAGREAPAAYGLQKYFQFHEAFPEQVIPSMENIQFAFVDGSHLFDYTILDFMLCDKKLEIGGVIAFHDCWMPSTKKFVRYLLNNRKDYELWKPSNLKAWNPKRTLWMNTRSAIAFILRKAPILNKILSQEILHPWHDIWRRNLIFFKKISKDTRHWTHFEKF